MNKTVSSRRAGFSRALTVLAAALCAASFTSCSSKIVVRFSSLPGLVPAIAKSGFENHVPSPVEPAGGFVYVQTGLADTSPVYGPFPVEPGKDLVVQGLPSGAYDHIALFYAPAPLAQADDSAGAEAKGSDKKNTVQTVHVAGLPVVAGNEGEFWEKTASVEVAGDVFHDTGAVALFGKTKIHFFGKSVLGARLIPLSATVFSSVDAVLPPCPDSAGKVRKQFIKIDGGTSQSLYVMLSNYQDKGIVYAGTIALYGGDGSLLDTKTFNRHLPEDLPESVLFKLPESGTAWLYAEYIAVGDTKIPLFFY